MTKEKKLLLKLREILVTVKEGFSDEGDRVYFGSTNHVDMLNEIIDEIDLFSLKHYTKEESPNRGKSE